jgi:predicted Zn-dependent protease
VRAVRKPPRATVRREQLPSWLSWLVLGLLWGGIAIGVIVTRARLPPPRILPPAAHPDVLIVPIGDGRPADLGQYPAEYLSEYGLRIEIGDPMPLDPRAFDRNRGQYVAQDLVENLRSDRPASRNTGRVVVGVTTADVYVRDVPWNWAFAWREGDGFAVLSAARISNQGRTNDRWWTFRKLVTRELGFLCFALPPTTDPYDLLYQDLNSESDLRRLSWHL